MKTKEKNAKNKFFIYFKNNWVPFALLIISILIIIVLSSYFISNFIR